MTYGDILNAFVVDYKLGLNVRPNRKEIDFTKNTALMYRMFMKALAEIQRKLMPVETSGDISLVSGTSEYDLPSDFGVHKLVKSTVGTSMNELAESSVSDLNKMFQSTTDNSGDCQYFAIYAPSETHKIKLFPAPNTSGTLTVFYYKKFLGFSSADNITLTTTFPLPDEYSEGVILYMINDVFGDDLSYARYQDKLDSLRGSRNVSIDTSLTYNLANID